MAKDSIKSEDSEAGAEHVENDRGLTFSTFCRELGRGPTYIRRIQSDLEIYVPSRGEQYHSGYVNFMRKIISLRTLNVRVSDVVDLFVKEKKILELLHHDSTSESPTWYLDYCDGKGYSDSRLMLTGYDVGFPLKRGDIQWNLDFRKRENELFAGEEMGEDVGRVIDLYLDRLDVVQERVTRETPILVEALYWSRRAFLPNSG